METDSLSFETIQCGLKVIDRDDNVGVVKDCTDIHNVLVLYEPNGQGLYCLDEKCETYEPLYCYNILK